MPKPTRVDIVRLLYANHGRSTLRYCGNQMKLRSSIEPQIKRRYNVFLICPAASCGIAFRSSPAHLARRSRRASVVQKRRCKDTTISRYEQKKVPSNIFVD